MDITSNELGLLSYYIMGGLVVVLFLLLISFILNNKRASRIEGVLEEMQERMVQSDLALADVDKSLDELYGKRRLNGGELKIPTNLQDITYVDEQGQNHNLQETINALQEQVSAIGSEQQRYYESIIQEQQGLVQSIASLNELMSSLQGERGAAGASDAGAANSDNARVAGAQAPDNSFALNDYDLAQEQAFAKAEQAFNNSANGGIFMPPGQDETSDLATDASFAQTASDIAKLVAKTDFSAIDSNSAPATIGQHMQQAERAERSRHASNSHTQPPARHASGGYGQNGHGQAKRPQGFRGGRDPMNPLGINNNTSSGTFDPAATFNSSMGFGTDAVLQENPTPGLSSGAAGEFPSSEQFIELEIEKPASPSDPQLSSLELNEQLNHVDGFALDAQDELIIPSNLEGATLDKPSEVAKLGDVEEVSLGMPDSEPTSDALGMDSTLAGTQVESSPLDEHDLANELSQDLATLDKALGEISKLSTKPNKSKRREQALADASSISGEHDISHLAVADCNNTKRYADKEHLQHQYKLSDGKSKAKSKDGLQPKVSVEPVKGKPHLTIDYTSSDSLDNLDNLKVAVNHEMSVAVPHNDLHGDLSAANIDYSKSTSTAPAPVVDMIYDHDYVQQQKERPNGISIDTLDKAKTFIEAGVSLTEISAKTGLSEDEIRLIYDVDENGKIKDTSEQFKKQMAQQTLEESGNEVASDNGSALSLEPTNPAAALDKDERQVIESMMQEMHDPFSPEVAKEVAPEALESAQVAIVKSPDELNSANVNDLPELSQEADLKAAVEQNKRKRQQALEQDLSTSITEEENLEAIDRLADSIISENEQKGLLSPKDKRISEHELESEDDPLNVLGDFKHKQQGASLAALAQSIKNTSDDYLSELEHDIDESLQDDSVTLATKPQAKAAEQQAMSVEQRVKANRQKVSSLASSKDAPSKAATASMQAQRHEQARRRKSSDQGAIGAVGSATSQERAYGSTPLGLDALSMGSAVPKQSSGRGLSALLGSDIPESPMRPSKSAAYPTVDEALAHMESSNSSRPLSLGSIDHTPVRATTNFSAGTALNPGMADVVAMAPMALGSIDGGVATGGLEDEDPAAILNQVVKGGLNSVASLSSDQLDTLNQLQATGMSPEMSPAPQHGKQHYANYQARNAYGIKRR